MQNIAIRLAEDSTLGREGETIKLSLNPSDVHSSEELATYLAGFRPFNYRADELSPVVVVDHDFDKFRTFSSDDAFRRVNVKGATSADVPLVDPKSGLAEFHAQERFVGSFVPRQTEWNASFDARAAATRRVRRALDLDREIDVFTMFTNPASWDPNNLVSAATPWTDTVGSDPIQDLQDMSERSAQPVTGYAMNLHVANVFMRHPKVRDHIRLHRGDAGVGASVGALNGPDIANRDFHIPGIGSFKVVESKVKNESTSALEYIAGNHVVLYTSPPGVPDDGEEIATSYTFRRRGESGTGYDVREVDEPRKGGWGGTVVIAAVADRAVMTGNTCGGLIREVA
jgi:hypothetical protein